MSGGEDRTRTQQFSYIDETQAPFLQNLWAGGQLLMDQQMRGAAGQSQGFSNQLYGQGQQFLQGLGNNPFMQGLQSQAGGNPELVASQTQNLGNLINQFSERQMSNAGQMGVSAGQFGGSRQGVANGLIGEEATRAFAQGSTDIMAADQQRALQAGIAGGGINAQSMVGGLNSLQGMYGLGMSGLLGAWAPMQMQQGILGSPTVVGRDTTQRDAQNLGVGFSFGG